MDATDPLLHALGADLGAARAELLLTRLRAFSNYPNTIKGAARMASDPEVEAAALRLVQDPSSGIALGLHEHPELPGGASPTQEAWGLLALAARADSGVLDRLPAPVVEGEAGKLASIRRAASKHAAAMAASDADAGATAAPRGVPTDDGVSAPQKVSEVKGWLAAHAGADPRLLAPHEGQRPAARRAALRALGAIASPEALAVLGAYARDAYSDVDLAELHRAWSSFDRRAFAVTMFHPASSRLDLGVCEAIEGIGAVPGLTSLDVVLEGGADLTPLAECTALTTLRVGAEGAPGLLGVEPLLALPALAELHLTRTTRNADLSSLQDLRVQRLRLDLDGADGAFLLRMPHLESLLLSGGAAPEDHPGVLHRLPDLPAHPDLPGVVLRLVADGVRVVVYRHERSWVTALLEAAGNDVFVDEVAGYIGFTRDGAALDDLRRRLFTNRVP